MLIIARRTRSKLSDVRDIIIRQKERLHSNFSISKTIPLPSTYIEE